MKEVAIDREVNEQHKRSIDGCTRVFRTGEARAFHHAPAGSR